MIDEDGEDTTWMEEARCQQMTTEAFFADGSEPELVREAKAICNGLPMLDRPLRLPPSQQRKCRLCPTIFSTNSRTRLYCSVCRQRIYRETPGELAEPEPQLPVMGPCPVRRECRDYAMRHRIVDGVWGGTDPKDRRNIRRERTKYLRMQRERGA